MSLPKFNSDDQSFMLLQTNWASLIDPVIAQPFNSGIILENVSLVTGKNIINHMLGRNLQGWEIIRQRGAGSIYDLQDLNPLPNLNLWLQASSGISVNLLVF